jgi:tRNA-2-methylthio-N6-dimethylallyladenosine synthase
MKYFTQTFGCQMNEADSQRIAAGLEAQGYSPAQKISDADLIIINTCSVRQSAEDKVYGLANKVGELRSEKQELRVILTGCMVGSAVGERRRIKLTELQRRMPWVDDFVELEKLFNTSALCSAEVFDEKRKFKEPALVPVMRGCDQFCSYCVVPCGRGPVRSRPQEEIIKEIKCLVKRGVRWVMLLGQSINDYDENSKRKSQKSKPNSRLKTDKTKNSFVELLRQIHNISGLEKISLLSFNPWNFPDELIDVLAWPKFERYIHLPVQSGDDEILRKMNRPYTVTEYKDLVQKIRQKIPGVRIGTDAIVGFPGETEEQFQSTAILFKELKFDQAFIAMYSERPGTAAAKLYKDDVPLSEKKRRHRILTEVWKGQAFSERPGLANGLTTLF